MQRHSKKSLYLSKKLGEVIRELRSKDDYSCRKFAYEYDISRSNLNKIENGVIDCKFTTLWKISEALGLKFSDFAKFLEEKLGEEFTLIDE